MRELQNVFVDWISLVSKNETPAVAEAENKFALIKTKQKDFKLEYSIILKNLNK